MKHGCCSFLVGDGGGTVESKLGHAVELDVAFFRKWEDLSCSTKCCD